MWSTVLLLLTVVAASSASAAIKCKWTITNDFCLYGTNIGGLEFDTLEAAEIACEAEPTCKGVTTEPNGKTYMRPFAGGITKAGANSYKASKCQVCCEGTWDAWSAGPTCGEGTRSATFTVTVPAKNGGTPCPETRTETVTANPCPVCKWTPTQDFCLYGTNINTDAFHDLANAESACAVEPTCKGVTVEPNGDIFMRPMTGGVTKTGAVTYKKSKCPVNCVGHWDNWSAPVTCGSGTQLSHYVVDTAAANGGEVCANAAGDERSQPCSANPCPVCKWTPTTDFCLYGANINETPFTDLALAETACAAEPTCKGVTVEPNGDIFMRPMTGGVTKTGAVTYKKSKCPVNCVGHWDNWSAPCTCGDSTQTSHFIVDTASANGGDVCANADGEERSQPHSEAPCLLCKWTKYDGCLNGANLNPTAITDLVAAEMACEAMNKATAGVCKGVTMENGQYWLRPYNGLTPNANASSYKFSKCQVALTGL